MNDTLPDNPSLLSGERPWPISRAELTASLRRCSSDTSLALSAMQEQDIPGRRPGVGRVRGLRAEATGTQGVQVFDLVVKEPQGPTRAGTADSGLREVSVYTSLAELLPVRTPPLLAYHPGGDWLVMDLMPTGRAAEEWRTTDYLLAIDQLVALHDRFWGLGEDLTVYPWLLRPLDAELNLHVSAVESGAFKIADIQNRNRFRKDKELQGIIKRIITHFDSVTGPLQAAPTTLLHGDYWPGNIHVFPDGSLSVYDWESAAIGPGVLDLAHFILNSRWYFDPLPIPSTELTAHYRGRMDLANGHRWSDGDWQTLWDCALLWTFAADWVDLLAAIPDTLLDERGPQLEDLLFEPVRAAAARQLPQDGQ
ncbi:MAG: aminoglycoside phosphotransferase family protein [Anaerolineae bacterium]|nr:MAG: aminoglycoside phosphotransferase family protein [Anaerolineae bacterium]